MRCVALFNLAVNFLTKFCGTTAILCSATQPSLSPLKENQVFEPYEMVANFQNFDKAFRRTVIKDRTGLVVGGMQEMCIRDRFGSVYGETGKIWKL